MVHGSLMGAAAGIVAVMKRAASGGQCQDSREQGQVRGRDKGSPFERI